MTRNHPHVDIEIVPEKPLGLLLEPFLGRWVAIAPDYSTVWASGDSLADVHEQLLIEQRDQEPLYEQVPPEYLDSATLVLGTAHHDSPSPALVTR